VTSLSSFYAQAAQAPIQRRRWALGAAYAIQERVGWGESIASARNRVMGLPQYAGALTAAGLDDDYAAVDAVNGGAPTVPPLVETFTGAANTLLDAHAADSSEAWTKHALAAAPTLSISTANRLKAGGTDAIYWSAWTPPSAEYDITWDFVVITVLTSQTFVCARMSEAAKTYYGVRNSGSNLELYQSIAGTFTQLGSSIGVFVAGNTYAMKLEIRDAVKRVLVKGPGDSDYVEKITYVTDNVITGAGRVGFRGGTANTDTTGTHIDNLNASAPAPPPTPPGPGLSLLSSNSAWSFFNNPHAVYQTTPATAKWLHVGGVTASGSPVVTSVNLATRAISETPLHAALQVDDHDPASLLVTGDGTLLATYSMHGDTVIRMRRTTNAEDPTSWGAETTLAQNLGEASISYPTPFRFASGRMMIFARMGATGTIRRGFVYSDDNGATWSVAVPFIETVGERPYTNATYNPATDLIDVIYVDAHPDAVNTSTWHVTIDSAGNVRKTDGTLIRNVITDAAAITATQGSQIYAYNATDGRSWAWDVCRDPADSTKIYGALVRFPSDTDHRYCWARWNGTAWTVREVVASGTSIYGQGVVAQPHYSGGLCLDRATPTKVYASVEVGTSNVWKIYAYSTANDGVSWTSTDLTPDAAQKNMRPVSPEGKGAIVGPSVVWMSGTYTTYQDYSTRVYAQPALA